ncbi:hypothetical protein MC118_005217 [Salmonella enterica]|nr:hypothetical protein [Salmonella enterica]
MDQLVKDYGQVIVDECHHIGTASFDVTLKETNARYVLCLIVTPVRRDGLHPVIFMQCGPVHHTAARPKERAHNLDVISCTRLTRGNLPSDARIQDVFKEIVLDQDRTSVIAGEVRHAFDHGCKVLVLTERTYHLDTIESTLNLLKLSLFVLHGRLCVCPVVVAVTASMSTGRYSVHGIQVRPRVHCAGNPVAALLFSRDIELRLRKIR